MGVAFFAAAVMTANPELVPGALASWLDESLRVKLGRCRRCMLVSGVLLVASWLLVVALATMEPLRPALLVAATALAVPITLLAAAHVIAIAVRSFMSLDVPLPRTAASDRAHSASAGGVRRGGCGCGRASDEAPEAS
jgi:hypothetical protein